MTKAEMITAIILAIIGSGGFWSFITVKLQTKNKKLTAEQEMLKGLGHDRICSLGEKHVNQGSITKAEYENLNDYLYKPYKALGGNGTAEKVMQEVNKLPFTKEE